MPQGMQDLFANLGKPPSSDQNKADKTEQPKFNNPFEGL